MQISNMPISYVISVSDSEILGIYVVISVCVSDVISVCVCIFMYI
jgi:hypothetical protein